MMNLSPFNTHSTGAGIRCPQCGHVHAYRGADHPKDEQVITLYCDDDHLPPQIPKPSRVRTHDSPPLEEAPDVVPSVPPHLHRTCRRCGFSWLEETAGDQAEDPRSDIGVTNFGSGIGVTEFGVRG